MYESVKSDLFYSYIYEHATACIFHATIVIYARIDQFPSISILLITANKEIPSPCVMQYSVIYYFFSKFVKLGPHFIDTIRPCVHCITRMHDDVTQILNTCSPVPSGKNLPGQSYATLGRRIP